jgi:hypothetical protein
MQGSAATTAWLRKEFCTGYWPQQACPPAPLSQTIAPITGATQKGLYFMRSCGALATQSGLQVWLAPLFTYEDAVIGLVSSPLQ